MGYGKRLIILVLGLAISLGVLSCERFQSPSAKPKWAHLPGQFLMGSLAGQIVANKNKIPTNRSILRLCLSSEREDFRQEDFVFESKLALVTWLVQTGFTAEDWALLEFQTTAECRLSHKEFASIIQMPNVTTPLATHAEVYRPVTMWCQYTTPPHLKCQTDAFTLGYGGPAQLLLEGKPGSQLFSTIEFTSSASSTLSPFVKWVTLRESIATNPKLDPKVKTGLMGRIDGLIKTESFEKYAELAALLEKYAVKDELLQDYPKLRAQIVSTPSLIGVRVPLIPRVAALHVLLHEVGHQFGMDHADNPSVLSTHGQGEVINSDVIVIEKDATMAYGEPLFYLTADDKAGVRNVTRTLLEKNLKEFDLGHE